MNIQILRFDKLGSTNEEAISQAERGGQEGLCVVANEQLAGRGREGRMWESGDGDGLYFSIILRPRVAGRYVSILTLLSAVAVYDTVEQLCGVTPDIKWPNDILVDGKKISGILAEMVKTSLGKAVIVGIGINMVTENLPPDLKETATSVSDITGEEADLEFAMRLLTHHLRRHYVAFNMNMDVGTVLREWSERSSYYKGKEVNVKTRNGEIRGVTAGLDHHGSLIIKQKDGRMSAVTSGDVEAVRPSTDRAEDSDEDVKP